MAEIHQRGVAYALGEGDWDAYKAALERARAAEMGDSETVSGFPDSPDAGAWNFLRTLGRFDPMTYWPEVEVPVLFLYGGKDANVDVHKSIRVIQSRFKPEKPGYDLLLFSGNGHALYREDAMDFLSRWILDGGVD